MDIKKHEPTFESIAGLYNRPRTKRLLVNGPLDYKIVEVRPDATIIMKDATFKSKSNWIGLGVTFGKNLDFVNPYEVKISLLDNHIPVACLRFKQDSIEYQKTVFTGEVAGRRCIYVHYNINNTHMKAKKEVDIWAMVIQKEHCELYEHANEDYVPFETVKKPWYDCVASTHSKNYLVKNDKILLSYDIVVKAGKIFFAIWYKLGFIAAVAVTRRGKFHLISAENHRLFASTVSAVAVIIAVGVMLGIAEMIVHLSVKCTLNNPLF